jgi:hypothetical protein
MRRLVRITHVPTSPVAHSLMIFQPHSSSTALCALQCAPNMFMHSTSTLPRAHIGTDDSCGFNNATNVTGSVHLISSRWAVSGVRSLMACR